MNLQERILQEYSRLKGMEPDFLIPLPPTASNRKYFRLSKGNDSMIACYNPDRAENEAFLYVQKKLAGAGVNVPEIYFSDLENHLYFQQDLGDVMLLDLADTYRGKGSREYLDWYKRVIGQMPAIQYKASLDFDFSMCFPRDAFDKQSVFWDLNYFKYYFLKLMYVPFHEQELENDFHRLADFLMDADTGYFLFRDFQSRNIMIRDNEVFFIDFQGGRRGALQYDLASLLFEAKARLTLDERRELLEHYLNVFSEYSFFDRVKFMKFFPAYCLIRMLQAFGAYGYRGYFEKKSLFLQSIPLALGNLNELLDTWDLGVEIPHLHSVLEKMCKDLKVTGLPESLDKLLISINSFSYKKGIPQDFTGHGGGFVFDCRALPNPGRLEEYKDKTGMDAAVIEFLEKEQDVKDFLRWTGELVSASVSNYLERGHEHLMISFGCTGGQHRSVYCAEQVYKLIREKYDVRIKIRHIEQETSSYGR
ncbi:MAG: phosphotransferase [Bacteroidales bacterium]|nr:phosphotransferase [Bacteroidales bacterium]